MDRFRFSIDLGTGYQLIDVYDNNMNINIGRRAESYALKQSQISGSFKVRGSIAESLFNQRTISYYVPFKVEALYSSIWSTLNECNIDIRGDYDDNAKTMIISKFLPSSEDSDDIIAAYKNVYNILDFSPALTERTIEGSVTSLNVELTAALISLSWNDFKLDYDIFGVFTGNGDPYGRWDYMLLTDTEDLGGGFFKYTWQTMRFLYAPGYSDTNGYIETVWQGDQKAWLKVPTVEDETETFDIDYSRKCYRVSDILDYIVSGLNSSYSFDNSDNGTTEDFSYMLIGNTSDLTTSTFEELNITLEQIFNLFRYYYGFEWYMDSNKLKFNSSPYISFNIVYDWNEEKDKLNLQPAYNPLPDKEVFNFKDPTQDPFIRSYFNKGVLTDENIFDYSNEFYHDIPNVKRSADKKDELFFALTSNGTDIIVRDMQWFNDNNNGSVYAEHGIWFVKSDPALDYGLFSKSFFSSRPLWLQEHVKVIPDWVSFDLFSRIKLADEFGTLDNYIINLNTGQGVFNIFF